VFCPEVFSQGKEKTRRLRGERSNFKTKRKVTEKTWGSENRVTLSEKVRSENVKETDVCCRGRKLKRGAKGKGGGTPF